MIQVLRKLFYKLQARVVTIEGAYSSILKAYLAATITYNNTVALANTALSVTVVSSGIYDIELTVHSTRVNKGLNMDFGGTASITNFIGEWVAVPAAGVSDPSTFNDARARVTAAGTDFGPSSDIDAGDSIYTFKGTIEVNAGGTFLLRGAQNSADVSNTTILRGSSLILRKLN